ncbi:uncharacterized protein SCHCODRAFT_02632581 [Schizophyllum commune H4-8]|uniref:Uncharacterized protein n=1 Tax=Schizophyllum commune (strain H4-8 / FGSC 9210) TaxID=578458 RepID=D8Q8T4_SCHCM|nr:uncharacterized protein SCHCODRAFT_02632581 [Schizophyllum commune H4-8]KAI5890681.1 hypothetical protein SCHCODRAFT_02632581 [Schizophyllum commune H4-8]
MANVVYFNVDDTSPQIGYSPFADTLSLPDLTGGWNPYYDDSGFADGLGETGSGNSAHITAHDGATISVRWRGTGIQLVGNATQASYSIALDGERVSASSRKSEFANDALVTLDNLQDTDHTLTFTTNIQSSGTNSSFIVFRRCFVTSPSSTSSGSSLANMTVADGDISFSGGWADTDATDNAPATHQSTGAGDAAQAEFNGTAVFIRGQTSPKASRYNVTLDGNMTTQLSARSSFTNHDALLFYATGLDPNVTHTIDIVNDQDGAVLALNREGFSVMTVMPPTASSPPMGYAGSKSWSKGAIAAFALGGILGFLILTGLLFYLLVYRPRRKRRSEAKERHHTFEPPEKPLDPEPILDIRPQDILPIAPISPVYEFARRESVRTNKTAKTGFERWKDEVENKVARSLGSLVFRHSSRSSSHSGSLVSSIMSDSSSCRNKSNSPSIIIELPRRGSAQQSPQGPATMLQAPRMQPSTSDITSLDYASTLAHPQSVQRGPSVSSHGQAASAPLGQPIMRAQDRARTVPTSVPVSPADDRLSPLRTYPTRTTDSGRPRTPSSAGHDRGVFLLDDGMSIFGRGGDVRQLSPRTSVADDGRPSRRGLSILIPGLPFRFFRRQSAGTRASDDVLEISPFPRGSRSEEGPPLSNSSPHPRRASRVSGLSVHFEESGGGVDSVRSPLEPVASSSDASPQDAGLRLTPPGIVLQIDGASTASPALSQRTASNRSDGRSEIPADEGGKPGASESLGSKAGTSSSGGSSAFPYPVSIPPSTHHPAGAISDAHREAMREADAPPSDSPTDTLPVSISDVHFRSPATDSSSRHSEELASSWRHSEEFARPAHPPLPRAVSSGPPQTYMFQRLQGHSSTGASLLTPLGPRTPGQPHDRRTGGLRSMLGRSSTTPEPSDAERNDAARHQRTGSTPLGPRIFGSPHRRSTSVPFPLSRGQR